MSVGGVPLVLGGGTEWWFGRGKLVLGVWSRSNVYNACALKDSSYVPTQAESGCVSRGKTVGGGGGWGDTVQKVRLGVAHDDAVKNNRT